MSIECSKTAKKQGTLNMFSFKPLTREEQVVKEARDKLDLITTNTEVHSPAVAINIEGGSNNTYNVQIDQHIYGKRVRKANTMHGSLKKGKYSS